MERKDFRKTQYLKCSCMDSLDWRAHKHITASIHRRTSTTAIGTHLTDIHSKGVASGASPWVGRIDLGHIYLPERDGSVISENTKTNKCEREYNGNSQEPRWYTGITRSKTPPPRQVDNKMTVHRFTSALNNVLKKTFHRRTTTQMQMHRPHHHKFTHNDSSTQTSRLQVHDTLLEEQKIKKLDIDGS